MEALIHTLGRLPKHHWSTEEKKKYIKEHGLEKYLQQEKEELQKEDNTELPPKEKFINGLKGEMKHKRGISNDLVAIISCKDRANSVFLKPSCIGRISARHLINTLGNKFAKDAILVTDSHSAYKGFADYEGITLEQIPSGKHTKGAFNLAHINSVHSELTKFFKHYGDVATKYLENYLALFQWQYENKGLTFKKKDRKMEDYICSKDSSKSKAKIGLQYLNIDTKGLISYQI